MKIRIGIILKMIFFILLPTAIIYIGVFGFISYNFKNDALSDAQERADSYAKEYANLSKLKFDEDMAVARTIAQSMLSYKNFDPSIRRSYYNQILYKTLQEHDEYISVWDSWELSAIKPGYDKDYGRVSIAYYRQNNQNNLTIDSLDLDSNSVNSAYYKIKASGIETITDPYFYSYTKKIKDQVLESSIVSPIITDNKFDAIVGIDVTLNRFQEIVKGIKTYPDSYAFLISNNGFFVAHPNTKLLGKSIAVEDSINAHNYQIIKNINEGKSFSYVMYDSLTKEKVYVSIVPFFIGKTITPWALGIVVPLSKIEEEAMQTFVFMKNIGGIGLIILAIIIWLISMNISRPLKRTIKVLRELAKGRIHFAKKLSIKSSDELGEMADSVNTLVDVLQKTTDFSEQIGGGNLNAHFENLGKNDILGNSIMEMRNSLVKANEDEIKRKKHEENLSWASEGLTKFAKILREDNNNIKKLSYNIISNLVNYIGSLEGGLYIKNDKNKNEIFYELIAHSGFLKEKYGKTRYEIGEDLVGQCVQEELTVFMNDIPDDYINIGSGIGETKPNSILIVPIKLNEEIYGVIELESFNNFEPYQIEFVEKLGEIIASTITNVKNSIRTNDLLNQSKVQADELASQEEEMRQNMEEMQATQEEAAKHGAEMKGMLNAIDRISLVAEYDMQGKIVKINDGFVQLLNLPQEQLIGKKQGIFELKDEISRAEHEQFWQDLREGIRQQKEQHINANGKDVWLKEEYIPILDSNKVPYKILNISVDVTEQRIKELKLVQLQEKKKIIMNKATGHKDQMSSLKIKKRIERTTQLFEEHIHEFQFTDISYLIKVYKGDMHKIKNIIKLYKKSIPEQLTELSVLAEKESWKYLQSKTNTLRTKMTYVGLKLMNNYATKIDDYCQKNINLEEIPGILNEMADAWKSVDEELKAILLIN